MISAVTVTEATRELDAMEAAIKDAMITDVNTQIRVKMARVEPGQAFEVAVYNVFAVPGNPQAVATERLFNAVWREYANAGWVVAKCFPEVGDELHLTFVRPVRLTMPPLSVQPLAPDPL